MQQVIVYRSQVEANMDQWLTSGDGVLYIIGAILFVCIFYGFNQVVEKMYGVRRAQSTTYYQMVVALIAVISIVHFFL